MKRQFGYFSTEDAMKILEVPVIACLSPSLSSTPEYMLRFQGGSGRRRISEGLPLQRVMSGTDGHSKRIDDNE